MRNSSKETDTEEVDDNFEFDFRLHGDRTTMVGTQYFELAPGPYRDAAWQPGSRMIDEYTFCLIEGIFENRVSNYNHFGPAAEVLRPQWTAILADLASLRTALEQAGENVMVALPYGFTLNVRADFERNSAANQLRLVSLIAALKSWLNETLVAHQVITVRRI
jgi:hypothetical protein